MLTCVRPGVADNPKKGTPSQQQTASGAGAIRRADHRRARLCAGLTKRPACINLRSATNHKTILLAKSVENGKP